MREYKSPICIRHAHLTCPLPLALESYWACEADCLHCVGRKLNRIWGEEQRVTNPDSVRKKLRNALRNKNPQTPMAQALKAQKAIWIGRKTDPYQPIEMELMVTKGLVEILIDLRWPFIICSRYQANCQRDVDLFVKAGPLLICLVEITPGGESDWELFERKRTTPVNRRLRIAKRWQQLGIHVGIRGEPFIPGYHTTNQFRDMLRRLRSYGLRSYNTYNLHMNEYTLQRLHDVGLDIERIWEHNQDKLWRPIQCKLCQIADEEGINLGCPDFVNVPQGWKNCANTCCGVDVPGAFTFNTHHWRSLSQSGLASNDIIDRTWEDIGSEDDQHQARLILSGKSDDYYTMEDAKCYTK